MSDHADDNLRYGIVHSSMVEDACAEAEKYGAGMTHREMTEVLVVAFKQFRAHELSILGRYVAGVRAVKSDHKHKPGETLTETLKRLYPSSGR